MSRVKHLFAVVLAALMLCLLMPITAFAEEASDGKMLIYAKLPSDWSAPHLWAWADDGTNAFDAWPGGEMEADSNNDGWYYCWIPETTNNIIINANEAAVQTGDYKLESKNAWVTVTDAENVEISYDAQTTGDLPEYTFCSNMAKSGMNPKTLQYLMGHSDIGVTLNTYTHVQYDDVETEMKRVVNAE